MSKYTSKKYLTEQETQLTKKFVVKYANVGKINILKEIQEDVKLFKNEVADYIKQNPQHLLSKEGFQTLKNDYKRFKDSKYLKYLIGSEYQNIYKDCCVLAQNILTQHIVNTKIYQIKDYHFTYYKRGGKKRNCSTYKKGDFKGVSYKKEKNTPLVKMINYLIYLDNEVVLDEIKILKQSNKEIGSLFNLYMKDKPELFKRVVLFSRRLREKALKNFINFEFRTGSHRKSVSPNGIHTYNQIIIDKSNSKYKYWLQYYYRDIDTKKGTKIFLPLLINKEYHNAIESIIKKNKSFNIILKGKKIIIDTTFNPELRTEKDFKQFNKLMAMDVNLKHNILSTNEDETYDFDRVEVMESVLEPLIKLSNKGIKNFSERDRRLYDKGFKKAEWLITHFISDVLQYEIERGTTDIILEDLSLNGQSYAKVETLGNMKISRLARLLRFNEFKRIFKKLANKKGIRVHFTYSSYTSQQCPGCGHIHRDNRKEQELFECVSCGHEDEADFNAPKNMINRLDFLPEIYRLKKKYKSMTFEEIKDLLVLLDKDVLYPLLKYHNFDKLGQCYPNHKIKYSSIKLYLMKCLS